MAADQTPELPRKEEVPRSRELVLWVEEQRGENEPEKHWAHRREFILRNLEKLSDTDISCGSLPPPSQLNRLLAFSMVWANHVFMGCRYPVEIMEKVLTMGECIEVNDAPTHTTRDELVSKVKKRGISSSNEGIELPCKKKVPEDNRASKIIISDADTKKEEVPSPPENLLQRKEEKANSTIPSCINQRDAPLGVAPSSTSQQGALLRTAQMSSNKGEALSGATPLSSTNQQDKLLEAAPSSSTNQTLSGVELSSTTNQREAPSEAALSSTTNQQEVLYLSNNQQEAPLVAPLLSNDQQKELLGAMPSSSSNQQEAPSGATPSSCSNQQEAPLGAMPSSSSNQREASLGVAPSTSSNQREASLGVAPSTSSNQREASLGAAPSMSSNQRETLSEVAPSTSSNQQEIPSGAAPSMSSNQQEALLTSSSQREAPSGTAPSMSSSQREAPSGAALSTSSSHREASSGAVPYTSSSHREAPSGAAPSTSSSHREALSGAIPSTSSSQGEAPLGAVPFTSSNQRDAPLGGAPSVISKQREAPSGAVLSTSTKQRESPSGSMPSSSTKQREALSGAALSLSTKQEVPLLAVLSSITKQREAPLGAVLSLSTHQREAPSSSSNKRDALLGMAQVTESKIENSESFIRLAPVYSAVTEVKNYRPNQSMVSRSSERNTTSDSNPNLPSRGNSQAAESSVRVPRKLTADDAKEKQTFFNRLYKTVAWKLVSVGGFSPTVNHTEILKAAIESLKAVLDVVFVPLKELADLPQYKSSPENIVCELRCKSVYLGTGCGKSQENAKAVASREALKLFLKKKVVVKICKRKYNGKEIEDLVLLDEDARPSYLPPALRNPQDIF